MRIRYNIAKIMAKANQLTREALIRDRQFLSVGVEPPHTPCRSFAYNLKISWSMAKNGKYDIERGVTAGTFLDYIIVMED